MDVRMRQAYEAEALAEILGEVDYYRLLQLPRTCAQADIEPAFREESRRLHPDRFARVGDAELRNKVNRIYRALNEAYRTLRDPDARSAYDNELGTGSQRLSDEGRKEAKAGAAANADPEQAARTEKGGKYWRMALQCWKDGDYSGCVMQTQFALTFEPDNEVMKEQLTKAKERVANTAKKASDNPYKIRIG